MRSDFRSVIALLTDFGYTDPFVGIMKGVIASIAPDAIVIDLCHGIPPQDIVAGALAFETAVGYFPPGTVFVGVVDPGVGSERASVAVETARSLYVGPDNGLFSLALAREPACRAVRLSNESLFRLPISATFHGRDIFAPVAAHLASGTPLDLLGEPIPSLVSLAVSTPCPRGNALEAHVLTYDRFGNLVTDLSRERYDAWLYEGVGGKSSCLRIQVGDVEIIGLHRTYSDVAPEQAIACFGSGGRLEIGVREGSAAERWRLRRGDMILLSLS